jgi:hypothetical protein
VGEAKGGVVTNKYLVGIVLIVLTGAIAYRLYVQWRVRATATQALSTDPNQFMPDIAAHAVQVAWAEGQDARLLPAVCENRRINSG